MSRIDRVRILLVSIGMYGQKYLEEATEKDVGGDVVGIVDVAPGLEEKFPVIRKMGIPVYASLQSFFERDHADLAVISSPIHLHAAMVLECLRNGVNVLCEKPLCLTEQETRAMAEAARKADRFLALGWQLNYDRAVLAIFFPAGSEVPCAFAVCTPCGEAEIIMPEATGWEKSLWMAGKYWTARS